ncbi:4'-phosphopantetheinyl transferase superfamily protein [Pseudoalteromonas sp. MMG012]|uniref:4'-phosphopantetheinyl transferase family protein n=1 Tax=Pseudoalteromonas sp. MMG012 TaxID=2822686 RepID=UPI001B39F5EE|nr:4'-phosphopantetheinyl transferase family protein [Pseudoalteromonas sp. MMG012]MBQ4850437.1 4'-phosphopantetheinyl transferase superfamily protein [Pseudoalteromonas sp. MMG012]
MLTQLKSSPTHEVYALHLPQLKLRLMVPAMKLQLMSHLSDDELATYHDFTFKQPALRWLGARLSAKWLLKNHVHSHLKTHQLSLIKNNKGAPFCAVSGLPVGLSYTAELAIAALCTGTFGIDTEHQSRFNNTPAPWLTPGEQVCLSTLGKRTATQLWCIKEALYKAIGNGPYLTFCQAVSVVKWQPNSIIINNNLYTQITHWQYQAWQLHQHDILLLEPNYDASYS